MAQWQTRLGRGLSVGQLRGLLGSLVRREVETRYRGTVLGFSWAVVQPLLMLAIYSFVFIGVFRSRWGQTGDTLTYVQMLYSGLVVHALVSDTLTRAAGCVVGNPGFVKKVVFPLQLIPVVQLGAGLVSTGISLVLLALLVLWANQGLPLTALLVPFVLLPLLVLVAGLAWLLAAVGVFFRDIGQIVALGMSMLLFLSPVFYPVAAAPPFAAGLLQWNPLTFPIEALRAVLVLGQLPSLAGWMVYTAVAVLVGWFGFWFFQRTRPAFADVL